MCLGFTRGSIWTTSMELGPQNHNRDGLLGPKFQNGGIYGPPLIRVPARDPSGVPLRDPLRVPLRGSFKGFDNWRFMGSYNWSYKQKVNISISHIKAPLITTHPRT